MVTTLKLIVLEVLNVGESIVNTKACVPSDILAGSIVMVLKSSDNVM